MIRSEPPWRLRGELDLNRDPAVIREDRQIGPMESRRPARMLAHLGAGDRLSLDPLVEADLAIGDHLVEPGFLCEQKSRRGADEPVLNRAGRNCGDLQPKPGVTQSAPRRPSNVGSPRTRSSRSSSPRSTHLATRRYAIDRRTPSTDITWAIATAP